MQFPSGLAPLWTQNMGMAGLDVTDLMKETEWESAKTP